ncbi:hypothetical protein Tco_1510323, partial [Tanacetum coccineum]
IIAINLDTSSDNDSSDSDNNISDSSSTSQISTSEEIDYDSPDYIGPPKSLLKWYGYLSDEYKDKGGNKSDAKPSFSDISKAILDSSDDDRKGPSKASVPIFKSTDKKNTDKDITDKDTTDEDCIYEYNCAMYKGKYVPVSHKHNPKVKSHVAVRGCVLGLANVTTWEEIVNKMRVRKSKIYAEKLAFAPCFCICICILHLQASICKQAFGSKHLQPAYAACICNKHLQSVFAACIFSLHLQVNICNKYLQQAFAACICKQVFASKNLQQAFAACI